MIRGTIPFFGPSFSMWIHLGHISSLDILAKTLEMFSPNTLVGMECVLMATDAGVIPEGVPVICCAGTERGLDTAWLVRSSASVTILHPERGWTRDRMGRGPSCCCIGRGGEKRTCP